MPETSNSRGPGRPNVGAMPSRPAASPDALTTSPTLTGPVAPPTPAVPPTAALPAVLLTAAEVAELLRIDAYTVRRYVARGDLPAYRVGRELRIDQQDVLAYLSGRRS